MGADRLKHEESSVVVPAESMRRATLCAVWLNRDDPESIPDMLDALGLIPTARQMRSGAA